jgi:hypothetical protein
MVEAPRELQAGALIRYRLRWHGVPVWWTTEITKWNPPHEFADRQISGPYALWNHEHSFAEKDSGTVMGDRVTYALPFGWLGAIAHRARVRRDVEGIFDFRAEQMRRLFPI